MIESDVSARSGPGTPSAESVLGTLTQPRLLDLGRVFGVAVRNPRESKARLVRTLASELDGRLPAVLRELGREELRAACRTHGLSDAGRAREELQRRLLDARGSIRMIRSRRRRNHHADGLPIVPGPPYASLHAKCVTVDGRFAFISSANFTARGQDRNIETGVLIDDPNFASHLASQWLGLIEVGAVAEQSANRTA